MSEDVSTAPTDISVAGSSVALTEKEEDSASYAANSEKEFTLPINFNRGDVSIAPTDASVAGSSVAATEAEEDALYADPNATINEVVLTNVTNEEGDDEDAAPMHLHVLRTPAKLKGAVSAGGGRRSRSSSRSRPGSRRNSNSPNRGVTSPSGSSKPSLADAASLTSSIEEDVDPDILLDKFGFQDLDPKLTQEELQELLKKHMSGNNSLPTLNERMSEETMEDVHAFQDLVFVKKNKGSSGTGSPSSGSMVHSLESEETSDAADRHGSFKGLEALNEEEEDEDDDEHAGGLDASRGDHDRSDVDQSPASSISGEDINLAESDFHAEECADVVVELPDPSLIQKEHDNAAKQQDSSVMAVEDKSDNEELNLGDEEAVVLPTEVMEELRISDECRLKGQKSREFDTTEGDDTEDR